MVIDKRPADSQGGAERSGLRQRRRWLRRLVRSPLQWLTSAAILALVAIAVAAPAIVPHDPVQTSPSARFRPPAAAHPFGTDRLGRDVLSRVIYGARTSMAVAVASTAVALAAGGVLGVCAAYLGGWVDQGLSQIMNIFFGVPALLLALVVSAVLGPGNTNAGIAIAVVYTPLFYRVVRGTALAEVHKGYVESAVAAGASHVRIIFRHMLPNVLSVLLVQGSITLAFAILLESALSFVGLGTQPPYPSWGQMLNEGRSVMQLAPWLSIFPGMAIMMSVLTFSLAGDVWRDVLDPRAR